MTSLKEKSKQYLINVGLYEKFQYSLMHRYFLRFFNSEVTGNQIKILDFHKKFLPENKLVFDIGANIGNKTEAYLKLNCQVIAVDPDQKNAKILKRRFHNNGNLTVIGKAISSQERVEKLYIHEPGSPLNTLSKKWKNQLEESQETNERGNFDFSQSVEVQTTTLDNLIDLYGLPYYIKIDVEGHELDVIKGLHHQIPLISFEVNLPEFREETLETISLLHNLNNNSVFNYVTDDISGFVLEDWVNADSMLDFVKNTNINYLEIFVKSDDKH